MTFRVNRALRTVFALPRRTWTEEQLLAARDTFCPQLLTDLGRAELSRMSTLEQHDAFARRNVPLIPNTMQVQVWYEFIQTGRHVAFATVGYGKTLLLRVGAYLAHAYHGCQRVTIVVPSYLERDTLEMHATASKYWRTPPNLRVVKYRQISTNPLALCDCTLCGGTAPVVRQAFLFDEADVLRSHKSAFRKRVTRLLKAHPDACRMFASGSAVEDGLEEIAAMLTWGTMTPPIPRERYDRKRLFAALSRTSSVDPSELVYTFGDGSETGDIKQRALQVYGRRIRETHGVTIAARSSTDVPLSMRTVLAPESVAIEQAFAPLRATGSDGVDQWVIGTPLQQRAFAVALGMGVRQYWSPRPPTTWLDARRAYFSRVNEIINASQRTAKPIDTELAARRNLAGTQVLEEWERAQQQYEINACAEVFDDSVLRYVAELAQPDDGETVIWIDNVCFAEALSRLTGLRYYGAEGVDAYGETPTPGRSMIASVRSNLRGRNWQAWNRSIVVGAIGSNRWLEQLLGRQHRQLQRKPVSVILVAVCRESLDAFDTVRDRSDYEHGLLTFEHKARIATWDTSATDVASTDSRYRKTNRWHKQR